MEDLDLDTTGRIYVVDRYNNCVKIYNSDSSYVATLGTDWGTGNNQYKNPYGIALGPDGRIFVADLGNHRIQVYNSSRNYLATMGVTGVSGSDNAHFNSPRDVDVDSAGNIYVADQYNHRIQVFSSNLNYLRTIPAGWDSTEGDDFGHLSYPTAVTVDSKGRIFVADGWGYRVQVFDSFGAYLTSIGGRGGRNSGNMRSVEGLAIDQYDNIYIAERENHRVQKFTPGVPGWVQTNINGFGDPDHYINSMAVFDNQMYAGLWNEPDVASVWRTIDGTTWNDFTPTWPVSNTIVWDEEDFGSFLYVGTVNNWGGELWRTDAADWQQVTSGGFSDGNNVGIRSLAGFSGNLYAATQNYNTGTEIWRSDTGGPGTWAQDNIDGFGKNHTSQDLVMESFGSHLYVGLGREVTPNNYVGELWRTDGGPLGWTKVFTDGLAVNNTNVSAMAEFNGDFYIGLRNVTTGGEVWKSSNGLNWTQVFNNGLGDANNGRPYGLLVFDGKLYLVFANTITGAEVRRTSDGTNWEQININGWGDSNVAYADYYDKSMSIFKNNLYVGAQGGAFGGQVWLMLNKFIYLPVIKR